MKKAIFLFSLLLIPSCESGTDHTTDIPTTGEATTSFEECLDTDSEELRQNLDEELKVILINEENYKREQKALAETLIGPMPLEKKNKSKNKKQILISPTDRSISLDASINASDRLALQK